MNLQTTIPLIYILFVITFFASCVSSEDIVPEIIDVTHFEEEALDDVTPAEFKFQISPDVVYSQWIINDTVFVEGGRQETFYLTITEEGTNKVEVNSIDKNSQTYYGQTVIEAPGTANTLYIDSLYISDADEYPITEDTINLTVSYFNSIDFVTHQRSISTSSLALSDTISFSEDITIDITGFEAVQNPEALRIDVSISGKNELATDTVYFDSSVSLYDTYFSSRIDTAYHYFDVHGGEQDTISKVRLYTDWTIQ